MSKVIDKLIINNPYKEPGKYWIYIRENQEFELREGRRKSGYWRATQAASAGSDDPGEFIEIDLVNKIRPRIREWRENGYPNVTGVTKKLLEFWRDESQREFKLFWCQLEAIETAIWLTEASPAELQGIAIPKDGGGWVRECLKLATGTGKTVVMAMLIAWQVLNKITYPKDSRFSKNILVISPGLTVRDRLRVLLPEREDNFYQEFNLVDSSMWQDLLQSKIMVANWHVLAPINENYGPKVVKKGPEGDEAFVKRVLSDFNGSNNILIINDEAHHCHRPNLEEEKAEKERATVWVSGIDRINRARGVLKAYDLTATPFRPTGRGSQQEKLFDWIVSDFGLNDAIESGLVKTPKIAVRDDSGSSKDLKSKLFHIYPQVKDDLNRRAQANEGLPDLVRNALNILGGDWLRTKEEWEKEKSLKVPPVLISICNRTETAARLEYSMINGHISVPELSDNKRMLRIDQEALDQIESEEGENPNTSKVKLVEKEREKFNTVGKEGKPGEQIQCVIGVNMLSEGWDARTVTHILGLRAFTSQLLCEQVIGRGLRRISYDINEETGLFDAEYVTVFGVPFTFLPVEQQPGPPKPEKPKTKIEPIQERKSLEIKWPHVLNINYRLSYFLNLEWDNLDKLVLSPDDSPTIVEVAPVIDGKPKYDQISELDLKKLAEENRLQTLKFQAAARLQEQFGKNWKGDAGSHIGQLTEIIDQFIDSDKLQLKIPNFEGTDDLKKIVIALNLQTITNHIGNFIKSSSKESPTAIMDPVRPVRSTATAMTWYTSKPTQPVKKSQLSHIVIDSGWEKIGLEFERNRIPELVSWVKNDHLGFEIFYLWQGQTHTYYPDFLIRFENNRHLVLEVKGKLTDQDKAKWAAAEEWVKAVNVTGNFGKWEFKVLKNPKELFDIVK